MLDEVRQAAAAAAAAKQNMKDAEALRDDAIRRALEAGVPARTLAEVTGLSLARLYQVRDRRR